MGSLYLSLVYLASYMPMYLHEGSILVDYC